jgi:hypothetical protein
MPPLENENKGLTFWDFLLKIFRDRKTFLIVVGLLLSLILCLLLFGFFSYDHYGIHIGKPKSTKEKIIESGLGGFDSNLKSCIDSAVKLKKDYVIENILINVDVDTIQGDSLIEKVRISYSIRSLHELNGLAFTEKYATSSNGILKHVFGTDKENLSGQGNFYDIPVTLGSNETKTIMTGCDYYFKLPLLPNRNEVTGDMTVNSKQDVYIYPNDEDVIKSLTIRIASNTLNIRPMVDAARRYRGSSIDKKDAFLQFDEFHIAKYNSRSISSTWQNLFPQDRVVIYFEWD